MDKKPVLPIIFGIPGLEIEKEWADFFQKVSPFGFILFARNLKEPKQIKRLVQQFHEVCYRDEIAILIDEEGGKVSRLSELFSTREFSQFFFGALGDRFGKTNVIKYAVLISCVSSFVSFVGSSLLQELMQPQDYLLTFHSI